MIYNWHVEFIPEHNCWSVFDADGFPIACNLPEDKARLIAAAPDLLTAGIEETIIGRHKWTHHETELSKAVAKARGAA